MPLAEPLRLCPHGRYLLYRSADGSPWCFCGLTAYPADEHLDERLEAARIHWDELGQRSLVADQWSGAAQALADMPYVVERITAAHVPDGNGRCRACTTPGRGTPRDPWPCSTAKLADAARAIRGTLRGSSDLE
ncbi:hypothetical protein GCM10009609_44490 [Pseudonocardia aurantiaca]